MKTKTTLRRRAAALGLALIMCAACAAPASAAEDATAAAMRLTKTTGTVDVTNSRGRELSLRDDMRLYSGYHVETQETSYAWISLDNTKLTKLDAVSELEVRKAGKELELLLNSGQLYFNVTEPLNSDESLSIRTSTMVTGIRGTSGWVRVVDQWHTRVYVLQGRVECSVTDPVTGQTKTTVLTGGDTAECVVYEQEKPGDKCDIIRKGFTEEDAGGFIQVELAPDKPHRDRIEADSGLVFPDSPEQAEDRLKQDEADTHEKLQPIEDSYSHQDHVISKDPVWEENSNNDDSGDSDSGGSSEPEPNRPLIYTSMEPVTDDIVDGWLAEDQCAGVELSGSYTLVVDSGIHVPAGKSLTLNSGIPLEIYSGQTLQVDGTATVNEQIRSQGAIVVRSSNTLNALGGIESENGSLETTASGRVVLGGTGMVGLGTIINAGTIQGNVTFSSGSFTNTGTHAGGTITCDSGGAAYTPAVHVNGGSVDSIVGGFGADITVNGGSVGEISNTDDGGDSITINGGTVGTLTTGMYTNVTMSGGTVTGDVVVSSSFTMETGSRITGQLRIPDGTVSPATVNITGGRIGSVYQGSNSLVNFSGGAVVDGLYEMNSAINPAGEPSFQASNNTFNGGLTISAGVSTLSGSTIYSGVTATGGNTYLDCTVHQGSAAAALTVSGGQVHLGAAPIYANSVNSLIVQSGGGTVYLDTPASSDLLPFSNAKVLNCVEEGGEIVLRGFSDTLDLTAGEAGDVIVLNGNTEYSVSSTELNQGTPDDPVILDLNGYTLQLSNSGPGYPDQYLSITGHYIIQGNKAGSAITSDNDSSFVGQLIHITSGGSVVADGGSYQNQDTTVFKVDTGSSLTVQGNAVIIGGGEHPTVSLNGSAALILREQGQIAAPEGATESFNDTTQVPLILTAGDDGSIPTINMSGGTIAQESNGPVIVWDTGDVYNQAPPPVAWFTNNPLQGTIRAKKYSDQNNTILYYVNDRYQLETLFSISTYSDLFETISVDGYTVLKLKN